MQLPPVTLHSIDLDFLLLDHVPPLVDLLLILDYALLDNPIFLGDLSVLLGQRSYHFLVAELIIKSGFISCAGHGVQSSLHILDLRLEDLILDSHFIVLLDSISRLL